MIIIKILIRQCWIPTISAAFNFLMIYNEKHKNSNGKLINKFSENERIKRT